MLREARQGHRPPFDGGHSLQERHGGASLRGARTSHQVTERHLTSRCRLTVGDPNQVVSASVSPRCVWSLTQATHPSGRIKTAVSAVTAPSAGSSHAPTYLVKGSCRQSASVAFRIGDLDVLNHLAGSTERLTLTRCR